MSKETVLHTLRAISRRDMGRRLEEGVDPLDTASVNEIKLGAILRIADATEAMARNHSQLLKENYELKNKVAELQAANKKLEAEKNSAFRQSASLRGVVTRRENEIMKLKEANGKTNLQDQNA